MGDAWAARSCPLLPAGSAGASPPSRALHLPSSCAVEMVAMLVVSSRSAEFLRRPGPVGQSTGGARRCHGAAGRCRLSLAPVSGGGCRRQRSHLCRATEGALVSSLRWRSALPHISPVPRCGTPATHPRYTRAALRSRGGGGCRRGGGGREFPGRERPRSAMRSHRCRGRHA